MQILVNTDNHVVGTTEMRQKTEGVIRDTLARFGGQITRVEVFFTDEDSGVRSTDRDKRCLIEVHLGGLKPIAAGERGATIELALSAAADTIEKTLDRRLGRLHDR
ncbi:MAG: hypothetical protein A4E19_01870 [Nitrospira sp. SG-bin1]|nr:MAG: hypothetical protein A4E19_01870 [Nitrospira sp. SG-bin1]